MLFIYKCVLGSPDDYTDYNATLSFKDKETRELCDKIYIKNDSLCEYDFVGETNEMFTVFMDTEGYDVDAIDSIASVTIDDSKESECGKWMMFSYIQKLKSVKWLLHLLALIKVGYTSSVYTIDESSKSVELCAVVKQPESGGTPRPFTLLVSAREREFLYIIFVKI